MKKLFCLIFSLLLLLSGGCKMNFSAYEHCESKKYGEVTSDALKEKGVVLLSLIDGNIFFYELSDSGAVYYIYNTETEKSQKIGEIRNFYLSGNDCVYVDNCLYWNVGLRSDTPNAKNALYSFNVNTGEFKEIQSEPLYQLPVNSFALGDQVVSFKGNTSDNITGISYLEAYSPKEHTFTTILSKEGNMETGYGEFIDAACSYNDMMYIMSTKDKKHLIEKYDRSGKLLESFDAEKVMELLDNQYLRQFLLIDENTLFVNNASRAAVLCSLKNGTVDIIESTTYEKPMVPLQRLFPNKQKICFMKRKQTCFTGMITAKSSRKAFRKTSR